LRGADAIKQAKELIDKAQTCFFCTTGSSAGSSGARPMSVQEVDEAGQLWFLSADDSHKIRNWSVIRTLRFISKARHIRIF
jgi:general stress protein 26